MTNGDGFPEGVEKEDHISHPTAKDYRKYGEERRQEALRALVYKETISPANGRHSQGSGG